MQSGEKEGRERVKIDAANNAAAAAVAENHFKAAPKFAN